MSVKPGALDVVATSKDFSGWVLTVTLVILLRHQLRVVFVDSTAASNIARRHLKWSVAILVLVAVLGSLALSLLNLHDWFGALLMLVYGVLFFVFSIVVVTGIEARSPRDRLEALLPVITDLAIVGFWYFYLRPNTPNRVGGMYVLGAVVFVFTVQEVREIYSRPFCERFGTVVRFFES